MRSNTAKSKKLLFEGRSTVLNVLFIAINVFGIAIFLNAKFVATNPHTAFQFLGLAMFLVSAVMLVILRGYYMYSYFARLVLGVVLLISGFGKLNDPVGFAEVLEQYFQDGALSLKMAELFAWENYSLESCIPWTLKIAVSLAIGEILLALMLIYHMFYKLAVFLVFGLVLVFTFVSFYSSTCDHTQTYTYEFTVNADEANAQALKLRSVNDSLLTLRQEQNGVLYFTEQRQNICVNNCGCMGESDSEFYGVRLTPQISFSRNIMLLIFTVIMFITQFRMLPNAAFENTLYGITTWIALLIQGILSGWFWLVVLSGIILYLSTNVRRFGVQFLKSSIGILMFISVLLTAVLYYVISFEPLTDFRSYAVGNSLVDFENDMENTQLVYVYHHKFTDEIVFLNEEKRKESPIIADSNYVFIRVSEHKINPFPSQKNFCFNPTISVSEIQKHDIQHNLLKPLLEEHLQELYSVENRQNGIVDLFYADEFNQDLLKDTNFIVSKFVGIHGDYSEFDLGSAILSSDLIFVWIVKDIRKISDHEWDQMKAIVAQCEEQEYKMLVLGYQRASFWYEKSKIDHDKLLFLNMEKQELNKICRSNLCLMVLKNGVIEAKYPIRGLPKFETISSKLRLE